MTPVRTYGSWSSPITAEVVVAGAVGLGHDVEDGVGRSPAAVELTGDDPQLILGVGSKGDPEAVITVHTQGVQALGQIQVAEHLTHDAVGAVTPARDLRNCLVLGEVTDAGSLVLVPVDRSVHIDRRNAPALPGIRIGLVQVGKGIVIVIHLIRVEV